MRNFGQHAERDVINRKVRFNVEGYNVFVLVVRGDCFKKTKKTGCHSHLQGEHL